MEMTPKGKEVHETIMKALCLIDLSVQLTPALRQDKLAKELIDESAEIF